MIPNPLQPTALSTSQTLYNASSCYFLGLMVRDQPCAMLRCTPPVFVCIQQGNANTAIACRVCSHNMARWEEGLPDPAALPRPGRAGPAAYRVFPTP